MTREVELGALEWMLNVCTPGYEDHDTPHLSRVQPNVKESFTSAEDFYELCQCLLYRYVVGTMELNETSHLRAYFAIYLGDGVNIRLGDEEVTVRRCASQVRADRAEATFVIAMSNPRREADVEEGLSLGTLVAGDWEVGLPIAGYRDDDPTKPRSTCARVFAVPVLWKECGHSASIGILGLSAAESGLDRSHQPMMKRLQLVSNMLGVVASRFSNELQPSVDSAVGIDIDESVEHRSFARRAVALRRAIGQQAIDELLEKHSLEIRQEGEEYMSFRGPPEMGSQSW